MKLWWQNRLIDETEACISPFNAAVLTGAGVFETLLASEGAAIATRRHHQRWLCSAEALGLELPDLQQIQEATRQVLEANQMPTARVRWTALPGASSDSLGQQAVWMVMVFPLITRPELEHVIVSPWRCHSQWALSGLKATSYAGYSRILRHAQSLGAGEALIANERDDLCEGSGSNVFLVRDGQLWTPDLASGCLAGVARDLVLELAERLGLATKVERMPMDWILEGKFEELFLTSSTRGVHPVTQVGNRSIPAPGPVTTQLRKALTDWLSENPEP